MSAMDMTCGLPLFGSSGFHRQRTCSASSGGTTDNNAYSSGYSRLPCGCLEAVAGGGYSRLGGGGGGGDDDDLIDVRYSELQLTDDQKEGAQQEELVFHSEDYGGGGRLTASVEPDLCAGDLCLLLAAKSLAAKDPSWAVVEVFTRLGIERSLEDHEEVLSVHRDTVPFGHNEPKKFVFRKDFSKYEFFHSPQQFFPADMVDLSACYPLQPRTSSPLVDPRAALLSVVAGRSELPPIFAHVWVREYNKSAWTKTFLLLTGQDLYISQKVQAVAKYLRSKDNNKIFADSGGLEFFASLRDHTVYRALNARNQFRAPTEWGLCLRGSSGLRCLACESERARLCWITAMRLAKYGKQLRENYRAFKSKSAESGSSPKEYNSYSVPNESVRSRVAMDFTGSVGRIVEDPQEARAIAAAEGYSWKRRWRPRAPAAPQPPGLAAGVHVTQPWFHAGMTREQAAELVHRHGSVDGVFLVRESRSSPGCFVLTYKCGGKVIHTQIQPVVDKARDAVCFSLDDGSTKFYDLLQLVEFYQLNAGRLPTRLTHYVVQGPAPSSNTY